MLHLFLWGVFLVWGLLGIVVAVAIAAVLGGMAIHMIADRRGKPGTVWCPVFRRRFNVVGTPPSFLGRPFDDLKWCERFGDGKVRCRKTCLRARELAAAATTN
ncbi:MAG: hypothetical protein HYR48_06215 [Gemmatimonadetes bacterium]|nr:hypothetical protein [Gemmatimonadota bacterium]